MKGRLILMLVAILLSLYFIMTFNVRIFHNDKTAVLFGGDYMSLAHLIIFISMSFGVQWVCNLYFKIPVVFIFIVAAMAELIQIGNPHRAFEIIDLISNLVGVLVGDRIYNDRK